MRRNRWQRRKVLGGPRKERDPHVPEISPEQIEAALRTAQRAQARMIAEGAGAR